MICMAFENDVALLANQKESDTREALKVRYSTKKRRLREELSIYMKYRTKRPAATGLVRPLKNCRSGTGI